LLVISAYSRPGVIHRFVNTTDVVATIAGILKLGSLSQFDYYGRPIHEVFAATPDLAPYSALKPSMDMNERNPPGGPAAEVSATLDWSKPDAIADDTLNRILWTTIKGDDVPYPGPTRTPVKELVGN
jgi:hypothetical protein